MNQRLVSTSISPEVRRLPNGMTLLLDYVPYVRSASLGVWVRTGSANEAPEQSGISHFMEHMLFKGTVTRSARDIAHDIESKGGQMNAFTSRDYTGVYVRTLDTHAADAVDVLADVLQNSQLCDFEKERNVVLEEIASVEDVPEEYAHDLLTLSLWPDHPLGRPVAGTVESVEPLTVEDLAAYYHRWYRPDNMVFTIAGSFDVEQIAERVAEQFTPTTATPHEDIPCPRFAAGISVTERDIAQSHLCMAFPGPAADDGARYVYELLASILGGGATSRLFERIREQEGLAYSTYAFRSSFRQAGYLGLYAGVAPENLQRTVSLVSDELRRLADEPVPADEMSLNREQIRVGFLMSLESTSTRASRMAKSMLSHGRILSVEEVLEAIDAVTRADIQRTAQELFRSERCTLSVLGPHGEVAVGGLPL